MFLPRSDAGDGQQGGGGALGTVSTTKRTGLSTMFATLLARWRSGTDVTELPSRDELIASIAAEVRKKTETVSLRAVYERIEHMKLSDVRALRVRGTAFETIEQVLKAAGIRTNGTVGKIMDSPLALTQNDVHNLVCWCNGVQITGEEFAERVEQLAS